MVKAYSIVYRFMKYNPITKEEKPIYSYRVPFTLKEEVKAKPTREEIIGFPALAKKLNQFPYVNYYHRRNYDMIETDLGFRYKSNDTSDYIFYLEISYEETAVSLQRVFDYRDSELAIQYLKDRGLNICPIGK